MPSKTESVPLLEGSYQGYRFLDNARFLSILSIVMLHCDLFLDGSSPVPTQENAIIQFRTFGVQLFFVNSGFLMADWLGRRNLDVRGYWNRRLHSVLLPWLIWVTVYIALDVLVSVVHPRNSRSGLSEMVVHLIFFNAFWFVPVLLFSTAIMLPLRRYWESRWFGFALALLSLFYGLNQYTHWLPPEHSLAILGFLFPLWVGVRLCQNLQAISTWVKRLKWWVVLTAFCASFALTITEDYVMASLGFPDTYNALQITNQMYSYVVLLILIKTPVRLFPPFVDPRKDSYGIYLTHLVVAYLLWGALVLVTGRFASGESILRHFLRSIQDPLARISVWLFWTVLVYGGALLTTKVIRQSRMAWAVGVRVLPKHEP